MMGRFSPYTANFWLRKSAQLPLATSRSPKQIQGSLSIRMPDPISALANALVDRYTLERALGRGGMATVFLARDLSMIVQSR